MAPRNPATASRARKRRDRPKAHFSRWTPHDYAQFSRDFSPTLLEALPEKNFAELRHRLEETSGHFQSVESLSEVSDPGYATFEMTASFEREPVRVLTWYPIGSHEMQGFWMDSENLQAFHSDD